MRLRLAVLLSTLAAIAGPLGAQELPKPVLDKVKASTVFVVTSKGTGTAFVFARSGTSAHLLTCDHVVSGETKVKVVFNSGQKDEAVLEAEVSGNDPQSDLASLRVKNAVASAQPLTLGKKTTVRETEGVFAAGFPFGSRLSADVKNPEIAISRASISSIRKDNSGNVVAVQLGGEVNPGNSGGPIVDVGGKVVGVAQSKILGTGTAFAVPPEQIDAFLKGGIRALTVTQEAVSATETRLNVSLTLVNPQDTLKAAGVLWMPATKAPSVPAAAGARVAASMNEFVLKIDGGLATGSLSMKRAASEPETAEYLFQPFYKGSDGTPVHLASTSVKVTFEIPTAPAAPGEIVKPAAPKKALQTLEAVTEREADGRSFVRVQSPAAKVNLGKTLLQIAAPPSGSAVYAIYKDQAVVKVYDPETWEPVKEILTPRTPTSIWCDEKRIVVACTESKVITFLDPVAGKPVKSVPLGDPDQADLVPTRVIGRAPDGSIMTLWQAPNAAWWDIFLYHVAETGKPKKIIKAAIQNGVYLRGSKIFLAQNNFRGSPSGVCDLLDTSSGKQENLMANTLFGPQVGWHRSFGHIFLTQDRKNVILPTSRVGESYGYQTQTYLADLDLKKFALDVPGTVFAESPTEGTLISWGLAYKDKKEVGPEIYYSSRSNGRVLRKISIKNFSPHPAEFSYVNPSPDVFFLPGLETVISKPNNDSAGEIFVVRCGPVGEQMAIKADPSVRVKNDPPPRATVGKPVVYAPDFERPAEVKSLTFKLRKGPEDIKVDPATGRMTWTPTDAYVGKYDVSIVALVDGNEVPVVDWTIEVGF